MPNVTIQSGSVCAGGNHRTVITDQGTFVFNESEITDARNEGMAELRGAFLDIVVPCFPFFKLVGEICG